jgi:hypothetical protein
MADGVVLCYGSTIHFQLGLWGEVRLSHYLNGSFRVVNLFFKRLQKSGGVVTAQSGGDQVAVGVSCLTNSRHDCDTHC